MIEIASVKHKDHLAPYAQELLDGLIPLLRRLNTDQLSPTSFVAVEEHKEDFVLRLEVTPSIEDIPSLDLWASRDQCILSFAESEQIEAHGLRSEGQELVESILTAIERYLDGITVVERYNKNGKLLGKEYFYGVDMEYDKDSRIGTSYFFAFPRRTESVVKRTHKFLKK